MAGPRVLIETSFIDLGAVRSDLERLVLEFGYEALPNANDRAHFEDERKLDSFCTRNTAAADVVVYVLGSNWDNAAYKEFSLAQKHIAAAVAQHKQLYLFLPRNVQFEYQTYLLNKDNASVRYRYVAHPDIYRLIHEISQLAGEDSWQCYDAPQDLLPLLKYQWATTFARLLRQQYQPGGNGIPKPSQNGQAHQWVPYVPSPASSNGMSSNGVHKDGTNGWEQQEPVQESSTHPVEDSLEDFQETPAQELQPQILDEIEEPTVSEDALPALEEDLDIPVELDEETLLQNKFIRHLSQGHQLPIEAIVEGLEAMDEAADLKDYFRTVSEGGNGRKWSFDCIDEPGSIQSINEVRALLGKEPYELPEKEWKAAVFS